MTYSNSYERHMKHALSFLITGTFAVIKNGSCEFLKRSRLCLPHSTQCSNNCNESLSIKKAFHENLKIEADTNGKAFSSNRSA